ncbi:MAG: FHA domain-containing protein [Bacillota bacterium]
MFEIILLLVKVAFTITIYLFIYSIIRLIYLDIKSMNAGRTNINTGLPYLKLINQRELLDFRVEETYTLSKSVVIGRQDKNDIVIKDPCISGIHAHIIVRDEGIFLKDLGSKNGTFINSNRLDNNSKSLLKDGDKIRTGQVEFLFVKGSK